MKLGRCCGLCLLRTGTLIIGLFTMITSGAFLVYEVWELKEPVKSSRFSFLESYSTDVVLKRRYFALAGCVFFGTDVLAAVLLIIPSWICKGLAEKFKKGMLPWVVWKGAVMSLWLFGYRIGMHVVLKGVPDDLSLPYEMYIVDGIVIILLLLTPYFCKVVVAYEDELRQGITPPAGVRLTNASSAHVESDAVPSSTDDNGNESSTLM